VISRPLSFLFSAGGYLMGWQGAQGNPQASAQSIAAGLAQEGMRAATDEAYRQLKHLFDSIDRGLQCARVTKVSGGEGRMRATEWVCELCREGFASLGRGYRPY
jgi:hypothetical protein